MLTVNGVFQRRPIQPALAHVLWFTWNGAFAVNTTTVGARMYVVPIYQKSPLENLLVGNRRPYPRRRVAPFCEGALSLRSYGVESQSKSRILPWWLTSAIERPLFEYSSLYGRVELNRRGRLRYFHNDLRVPLRDLSLNIALSTVVWSWIAEDVLDITLTTNDDHWETSIWV